MYSLKEIYEKNGGSDVIVNFTKAASVAYGVSEETILLYKKMKKISPFITLGDLYDDTKGIKKELQIIERRIKIKKIKLKYESL